MVLTWGHVEHVEMFSRHAKDAAFLDALTCSISLGSACPTSGGGGSPPLHGSAAGQPQGNPPIWDTLEQSLADLFKCKITLRAAFSPPSLTFPYINSLIIAIFMVSLRTRPGICHVRNPQWLSQIKEASQ
jgi:hypothetical protein